MSKQVSGGVKSGPASTTHSSSAFRKNRIGMRFKFRLVWLGLIAVNAAAFAQTVTTSGGTTNKIPVFTGSAAIGDSPIAVSGNKVGIGTTSPSGQLHVAGTGSNVLVVGEASGTSDKQIVMGLTPTGDGLGTIQAVYQGNAFIPLVLNPNGGNVGIGTTAPTGVLDVSSSVGGVIFAATNIDPNSYTLPNLANTAKMLIGWNRSSGNGEFDFIANRAGGGAGGYGFYDYTNAGAVNNLMMLLANGNLGLGTTSPGAKLEVNGNMKFTSGSGASVTYPDGTVQSTAWNGVLSGGDYAESVDVSGDRAQYQPGDLLVIDAQHPDKFLKASEPYSQMIAGVYSTKPGLTGRRMATAKSANEVPMAMMGIVPTKVSSENGAIKPGDLLVSSSSAGYAMRGTSRGKMMGAVVGKAMGNLDAGKGVIEVLVYLQ